MGDERQREGDLPVSLRDGAWWRAGQGGRASKRKEIQRRCTASLDSTCSTQRGVSRSPVASRDA